MRKILTVLGARPQFIKASVVSSAISHSAGLEEVVVHTGQHFDVNMSDVFFSELGMAKPAYQLGIHGGSHGAMTGRMLAEVERVLLAEKPDVVLVYGDTNSTLAGALAAIKLHVPVAHVEAGLRSFNMAMPEEINRILTDRISRWLFAPTEAAVQHLVREGINESQIISVGDVMFDAVLHHGARVNAEGGLLERLDLRAKDYLLATIHRAENTDDPVRLTAIVGALCEISKALQVVWPLHPRTRNVLIKLGLFSSLSQAVRVIDPVGYFGMLQLEKYSALIATDSGGVQKEAFFHRVPCVTLRNETEWTELVDAGWNTLVPTVSKDFIKEQVFKSLNTRGQDIQPYGSGKSSSLIVANLEMNICCSGEN